MKNIGNFLVGSLSSLGVSHVLPCSVDSIQSVNQSGLNTMEAIVSLLSGILSALIIAWVKRQW